MPFRSQQPVAQSPAECSVPESPGEQRRLVITSSLSLTPSILMLSKGPQTHLCFTHGHGTMGCFVPVGQEPCFPFPWHCLWSRDAWNTSCAVRWGEVGDQGPHCLSLSIRTAMGFAVMCPPSPSTHTHTHPCPTSVHSSGCVFEPTHPQKGCVSEGHTHKEEERRLLDAGEAVVIVGGRGTVMRWNDSVRLFFH